MQADEVVAADRERSPVRAVRKALDVGPVTGRRSADLLVGPGVEEENPGRRQLPTASVFPSGEPMAIPLGYAFPVHSDGRRVAPECSR